MLTKATVKLIQSLKDKKSRQQHHLFVAEGSKTVRELLASKIKVKTVFATADWLNKNSALLKNNIEFTPVTEKELKQVSSLVTPQEVVAVVQLPEYDIRETDFSKDFSIVLDGIQDPGNLGTIIRIADWYGIEHIVCSPQCADAYNPKVVQATMGSFMRVKIHYTELEPFLQSNKTIPVFGALMNGDNLYQTKLKASGILLIGNEGAGISESLLKYITHPITIPRRGEAESLNAAVAAAIICDSWARENYALQSMK
jgi:TrmH family RNA methyltransferase